MATVPNPSTVAAGDKIPAATWNTDVRDEGLFWTTNRPLCVLNQAVAQSGWTSATFTAVSFTTEDVDRDAQHDPVTNNTRITIGKTLGWYRISGCYVPAGNAATTLARAFIRLNGTTGIGGAFGSMTITSGQSISYAIPLASCYVQATTATDYIELLGWQTAASGTIGTGAATGTTSHLSAEWVGL